MHGAEKSGDICTALLSYRATPLPWCNLSPAELHMGRHIRTPLPQRDEQLIPKWPYLLEFRKLNQTFKERQEYDFNKHHQVQDLPSLPDDMNVWVTFSGEPIQGRVIEQGDTPRSYLVNLPSGQIRRNCHQLKPMPDLIENDSRPNRHNVQSKQPELS